MKTLLLIFIFAAGDVIAQTNLAHIWHQNGKAIAGDYVSSGTTSLVIKFSGTNYFIALTALNDDDRSYLSTLKIQQRKKQMADEAVRLITQGTKEITAQLLDHFPEKVSDRLCWLDGEFGELNDIYTERQREELGFDIKDQSGTYFGRCLAFKTDPNGNPDPVIDQILKLKKGDTARFIGVPMYPLNSSQLAFYVSRVEIIETAAEKKMQEPANTDPYNLQIDPATGFPKK